MSKKTITFLWVLTGIAAITLSIFTVKLYNQIKASEIQEGIEVYIAGDNNIVLLRENPTERSRVSAIIEFGSRVTIMGNDSGLADQWYFVESEAGSGWISANLLSSERPE